MFPIFPEFHLLKPQEFVRDFPNFPFFPSKKIDACEAEREWRSAAWHCPVIHLPAGFRIERE
jgi:hypothetical protein